MENSPRYRDGPNLLPSPTSHSSCCSTTESTRPPPTPTTRPVSNRSEPANPYPTTFVQAETSTFKHVVQMLTGSSETAKLARPVTNPIHHQPDPVPPKSSSSHSIPPIKVPNKKQSSSGFRLYERRNSLKNLKINPVYTPVSSGLSPCKPEILSPSILDFPSLVLSPVTPLIPDPFDRTGSMNLSTNCHCELKSSADLEERTIMEKGFFLHPSPTTTPRDSEPRLLPLFPMTSPGGSSGSSGASTA